MARLLFVPSGAEHTQLCKSHSIFKDAFCVDSIATSVFFSQFNVFNSQMSLFYNFAFNIVISLE